MTLWDWLQAHPLLPLEVRTGAWMLPPKRRGDLDE